MKTAKEERYCASLSEEIRERYDEALSIKSYLTFSFNRSFLIVITRRDTDRRLRAIIFIEE